jgi:tRNA(fMet)-specific endonuclease VapC
MLDTSTVILLGRLASPADLPDDSVVSAVTLAELSVGTPGASAAGGSRLRDHSLRRRSRKGLWEGGRLVA